MTFNIYFFIIFFIVCTISFKDKAVIATDIMEVCTFGTISAIVSSYMMNVKCQIYFYEYEVSVLSKIDLLKGLSTRNSFEQKLNSYQDLCKKSLCCIYKDYMLKTYGFKISGFYVSQVNYKFELPVGKNYNFLKSDILSVPEHLSEKAVPRVLNILEQ